MPGFIESIDAIRSALAEKYGRGNDPIASNEDAQRTFPAVVAAFLSRTADDRAVVAAVEALRDDGRLDPRTLAESDPVEVEDAFRSSGSRTLAKAARPLVRLAKWVAETFDVDPDDGGLDAPTATEALRESLRGLNGIGPATADAILLEGLGRPAYPVDRASYRILARHGWIDVTADYDEARSSIEAAVPDDVDALRALSGDFERLGRENCRASAAKCDKCPLRDLLPEGGPLGDS